MKFGSSLLLISAVQANFYWGFCDIPKNWGFGLSTFDPGVFFGSDLWVQTVRTTDTGDYFSWGGKCPISKFSMEGNRLTETKKEWFWYNFFSYGSDYIRTEVDTTTGTGYMSTDLFDTDYTDLKNMGFFVLNSNEVLQV